MATPFDRTMYEKDGFVVSRNHEGFWENADNAVYVQVPPSKYGHNSISTGKAREIVAALIAAADSFEALKPDPQAEFVAKLESLGLGAVIETRLYRYTKNHNGQWRGPIFSHCFATGEFSHKSTTILSEGVK